MNLLVGTSINFPELNDILFLVSSPGSGFLASDSCCVEKFVDYAALV